MEAHVAVVDEDVQVVAKARRRPFTAEYKRRIGLAEVKWQQWAAVLRDVCAAHPGRFARGVPVPPPLSTAAWINKPPASPALAVPEGAGS